MTDGDPSIIHLPRFLLSSEVCNPIRANAIASARSVSAAILSAQECLAMRICEVTGHQGYQTVHTSISKAIVTNHFNYWSSRRGWDKEDPKFSQANWNALQRIVFSSSSPVLRSRRLSRKYPRCREWSCTFGSKSVSLRQCRTGVPWIARQDTAL